MIFGATVLDAEFREGELTDSLRGGPPQSIRGDKLPRSSPFAANLGLTYDHALDSGGTVTTSVLGNYQGRRYFTGLNELAMSQGAIFLLNASITYRPPSEQW